MFTDLDQIKSDRPLTISELRGSSDALLVAELAQKQSCCCIVADDHLIASTIENIRAFTDQKILAYPSHEIPPYAPLSPDQSITATRLATLYRAAHSDENIIIVASCEALLRRVIPKDILENRVELLLTGEEYEREELVATLIQLGYESVSLTKNVGDFAVRGGIIDIYPPPFALDDGREHTGPIRLDFFGESIESLRSFDPVSQRSTADIEEAILLPCKDFILAGNSQEKRAAQRLIEQAQNDNWQAEAAQALAEKIRSGQGIAGIESFLPLFFEKELSCLFNFLPADCLLIEHDTIAVKQSQQLCYERIDQNYHEVCQQKRPALEPTAIYLQEAELQEKLAQYPRLFLSEIVQVESKSINYSSQSHTLLKQEIARRRGQEGLLPAMVEKIREWQADNHRTIICCRSQKQSHNLGEMLSKYGFSPRYSDAPIDLKLQQPAGEILFTSRPLREGFSLPDLQIDIISESELFGQMRLGSKKKSSKKWGEPIEFTELNEGDIVVHRDHGLGYYCGLHPVTVQGITNDFMTIEYRDADKLYLPVDRLNLVSRYQGLADKEPRIDKLGSSSWRSTTKKVKEEVWKVAHELLDIYAKREIRTGRQFSTPGALFHELEESFAFDETPGQQKAIDEVLADLTSTNPMDRLVCGDVGYGKTEVAVRAAFKAVEDDCQVALLVPTTVLAEQHLKTFRSRLENFPVRIECLNRFRSSREQREIVRDLKEGKIDILIGTHRILSKDIIFKDLGLLIIDEEHRFGVAHKEKLRKLRAEVDILTLTATPIPRTLQMSLLSIRDLSVISTPPERRLPVKTFVAEHDDLVIKEAIKREIRRKGQTFFVHNRVKSIYAEAANIEKLVPEARVAIAHGQMATKELEEIMVAFVNREIDVLVATTIIESGLDIPSANTIILNRADHLGLAEMYQLRGRVGRSATQSYAYLLVPSLDSISRDSQERLRALMECNELGGGFKLAMNDLQIRGGGNLLGISQSGNIAAIGYDLYLDLLQRTVQDLKEQQQRQEDRGIYDDLDPEINLQISAFIPSDYISDINQRYVTYRKIAALCHEELEAFIDIEDELEDRYGTLPAETRSLIKMIAVKRELIQLRINKLERGRGNIVFSFEENTPVQPAKLMTYIAEFKATKKQAAPKLTQDGRLIFYDRVDEDDVFSTIHSALGQIKLLTEK